MARVKQSIRPLTGVQKATRACNVETQKTWAQRLRAAARGPGAVAALRAARRRKERGKPISAAKIQDKLRVEFLGHYNDDIADDVEQLLQPVMLAVDSEVAEDAFEEQVFDEMIKEQHRTLVGAVNKLKSEMTASMVDTAAEAALAGAAHALDTE